MPQLSYLEEAHGKLGWWLCGVDLSLKCAPWGDEKTPARLGNEVVNLALKLSRPVWSWMRASWARRSVSVMAILPIHHRMGHMLLTMSASRARQGSRTYQLRFPAPTAKYIGYLFHMHDVQCMLKESSQLTCSLIKFVRKVWNFASLFSIIWNQAQNQAQQTKWNHTNTLMKHLLCCKRSGLHFSPSFPCLFLHFA